MIELQNNWSSLIVLGNGSFEFHDADGRRWNAWGNARKNATIDCISYRDNRKVWASERGKTASSWSAGGSDRKSGFGDETNWFEKAGMWFSAGQIMWRTIGAVSTPGKTIKTDHKTQSDRATNSTRSKETHAAEEKTIRGECSLLAKCSTNLVHQSQKSKAVKNPARSVREIQLELDAINIYLKANEDTFVGSFSLGYLFCLSAIRNEQRRTIINTFRVKRDEAKAYQESYERCLQQIQVIDHAFFQIDDLFLVSIWMNLFSDEKNVLWSLLISTNTWSAIDFDNWWVAINSSMVISSLTIRKKNWILRYDRSWTTEQICRIFPVDRLDEASFDKARIVVRWGTIHLDILFSSRSLGIYLSTISIAGWNRYLHGTSVIPFLARSHSPSTSRIMNDGILC